MSLENNDTKNSIDNYKAIIADYRDQIDQLRGNNQQLYRLLTDIERSFTWRILRLYQSLVDQVLPESTKRRLFYDYLIKTNQKILNYFFPIKSFFAPSFYLNPFPNSEYINWIENNEPNIQQLRKQKLINFDYQPLISIVMPCYNPVANYLAAAIQSVIEQSYSNWELCIAFVDTTSTELVDIVHNYADFDQRIKLIKLSENKGIGCNTNLAIERASGEFLSFLDHDDTLAPNALFEIVSALNTDRSIDLLYSDEDKINSDGDRFAPVFKPAFSQLLIESGNFVSHLLTVRYSLGQSLNWLDSALDGAQDYDFVLRVSSITNRIYHIPKILYHWRATDVSMAKDTQAKPYAYQAAISALEKYLTQFNYPTKVLRTETPGYYRIKRFSVKIPTLSIIVPNKDNADLLACCITSIYSHRDQIIPELIIVDNDSSNENMQFLYANYQKQYGARIVAAPGAFNFSYLCNQGAAVSSGDLLLFLNNDIQIISDRFLETLAEYFLLANVGAVGPKLLYPNNTLQSGGIAISSANPCITTYMQNTHNDNRGYLNTLAVASERSAITGACLLTSRNVFEKVGAWDEAFPNDFNDIEYCLRLRNAGYSVVWTPYAKAYHLESATRGKEDHCWRLQQSKIHLTQLKQKWPLYFRQPDPYLRHVNLN